MGCVLDLVREVLALGGSLGWGGEGISVRWIIPHITNKIKYLQRREIPPSVQIQILKAANVAHKHVNDQSNNQYPLGKTRGSTKLYLY